MIGNGTRADSRLDEFGLAAQPALQMRLRRRGIALQELVRGVARLLDQRDIALEIGEAQQRHARLPRAQELAGPADERGPGARSRSRRCSRRSP